MDSEEPTKADAPGNEPRSISAARNSAIRVRGRPPRSPPDAQRRAAHWRQFLRVASPGSSKKRAPSRGRRSVRSTSWTTPCRECCPAPASRRRSRAHRSRRRRCASGARPEQRRPPESGRAPRRIRRRPRAENAPPPLPTGPWRLGAPAHTGRSCFRSTVRRRAAGSSERSPVSAKPRAAFPTAAVRIRASRGTPG